MIKIGVIGAGHWGPNLIRNFDNKLRSEVAWVADLSEERLASVGQRFPATRLTTDTGELMADDSLDAVVVATPTRSHFELVRTALELGRHVLVEKPLTADRSQAAELVALADRAGSVLLVGHVFLYNPAVRWIKRRIDDGTVGRIYYVSSERTNLGPVRMDVSASWDLAAQDISIFNYWLGDRPVSVSAAGGTWINEGVEDAVFTTLRYPSGVLAHLHVSWLNPRKVRDITVVADQRMITYDDMSLSEPVRVYDKQITEERRQVEFVDSFASFRSSVREGEVTIPPIKLGEPLRAECEHFLDCIEKGEKPRTGGPEALAVVETLEAIDRSMAERGREVEV